MIRRAISVAAVAVLLAATGAACDGDDETAAQQAQSQVCSDADAFQSAVSKLIDDITSGNFGDAQDQLSTVQSSFQSLEESAKKLASSKEDEVQGQLDDVQSTLASITSADSLDDIVSAIGTAGSQFSDAVSSITDALRC